MTMALLPIIELRAVLLHTLEGCITTSVTNLLGLMVHSELLVREMAEAW